MPDAWGIEERYVDARGDERAVAPETLARVREIIGAPVAIGPIVVRRDHTPAMQVGHGELTLEDGAVLTVDGALPDDLPLGYHELRRDEDGSSSAPRPVIVAPPACHLPGGWRAWGWVAQLYATRSSASWGIGDFGDLAELARWAGTRGARFVLVNPLGAVSPTQPQQPSPYYPASRRFLNPIYIRVTDVPGADAASAHDAVARAAAAGTALNATRIIDRDDIWRIKLGALEAIWSAAPPFDAFEHWYERQPDALRRFATWSTLAETHGGRWQDWPAELRTADGTGVRNATADDRTRDRVLFFAWLQWLATMQLGATARATALVQDLPIGVDPHGFDAWEWQDVLAPGVAVGAPPDAFNNRGQNWGLPPFDPSRLRAAGYRPFIDTIRTSMARGGGVRIDHVMGLFRLWWVPEGNDATDGAYVRYPAGDLLAILALESERAGAFVVGEDLGTVEDSVRAELAAHDVLSYRLLWFEDREPPQWPRKALGAITTHDLPTVVGLWNRNDLAAQRAAGLDPSEADFGAVRERLARRGGLHDDAPAEAAVVAAHQLLGRAPSVLLAATLEDAIGEEERPNIPGADGRRPNWSLALASPLEAVEEHPLAARVAALLTDAVEERSDERHA